MLSSYLPSLTKQWACVMHPRTSALNSWLLHVPFGEQTLARALQKLHQWSSLHRVAAAPNFYISANWIPHFFFFVVLFFFFFFYPIKHIQNNRRKPPLLWEFPCCWITYLCSYKLSSCKKWIILPFLTEFLSFLKLSGWKHAPQWGQFKRMQVIRSLSATKKCTLSSPPDCLDHRAVVLQ